MSPIWFARILYVECVDLTNLVSPFISHTSFSRGPFGNQIGDNTILTKSQRGQYHYYAVPSSLIIYSIFHLLYISLINSIIKL